MKVRSIFCYRSPKSWSACPLERFAVDWETAPSDERNRFDLGAYFDPELKASRSVGAVSYGASGGSPFSIPQPGNCFRRSNSMAKWGPCDFQYGSEQANVLIVANLSGRSLSLYNTAQRKRIVELPFKESAGPLVLQLGSWPTVRHRRGIGCGIGGVSVPHALCCRNCAGR